MQLLSNWKEVLLRAWSVRLLAVVGILSGLEVALPYFEGVFPVPSGLFGALAGLCSAAALVARILVQNNLPSAPATGADDPEIEP